MEKNRASERGKGSRISRSSPGNKLCSTQKSTLGGEPRNYPHQLDSIPSARNSNLDSICLQRTMLCTEDSLPAFMAWSQADVKDSTIDRQVHRQISSNKCLGTEYFWHTITLEYFLGQGISLLILARFCPYGERDENPPALKATKCRHLCHWFNPGT